LSATILVRYGELALKSPPVRREFERTLQRNILEQFRSAGLTCRLRADHGHLYVGAEDATAAIPLLQRVFGVTSVSAVTEVDSDRETIERSAADLADPMLTPGVSFAVRARRTGEHPFTSQELAKSLGGRILERWPDRGLHVDLEHPGVEITVEVRGPRTYLYFDRHAGPGGLPLGVAGQVVALVDGPRGALGAYLMMKRGCRCAVLPEGPEGERSVATLARFDPRLRSLPPSTERIEALARAAEELRADAIVLPLAVEEYAGARTAWGDRVIFSPTVGMTPNEVESRWQRVERLAA
jgi:tRNA uracil 4-sulfurtransferase